MSADWNLLRKYEGEGTWRTLPELARQLGHERLGGGYRTRGQHYPDGSQRYRYAGDAERDPDYRQRLDAAAEAHEQAERTRARRQQRPGRERRSR